MNTHSNSKGGGRNNLKEVAEAELNFETLFPSAHEAEAKTIRRKARMKTFKLSLVIMAAALLTIGLSGMAYAFHSGGVADCGGCHSMHSPKAGGSFLLIGSDQSSTCLSCHAKPDTAPTGYHVMTYPVPAAGSPPVELTPGGDFGWILKTYNFTVRGTPTTELGDSHGHNVVATEFGISTDATNATAPGGTFPSGQLACNSCHDPHGKFRRIGGDTTYTIGTSGAPIIGSGSYATSAVPTATQAVGVYRLLAGQGYAKVTYPGVPAAVVPSSYNRSEATTQTRAAYGYSATGGGKTNWGEWCGACHPNMHSGFGNYVHPTEQTLGSTVSGNYQTYVNSGNTTGGSSATSFLSLVPFIESTSDYAALKLHAKNDDSALTGPASSDRVSCLSCHRAHATGWPEGLRWNTEWEFISYVDGSGNPVWPGTDNQPAANGERHRGRTELETRTAYYLRPVTIFGAYQRSLCNKCHAQD